MLNHTKTQIFFCRLMVCFRVDGHICALNRYCTKFCFIKLFCTFVLPFPIFKVSVSQSLYFQSYNIVCFDGLHHILLNVSISEPDFSQLLISNELRSKQCISGVMHTIPLKLSDYKEGSCTYIYSIKSQFMLKIL